MINIRLVHSGVGPALMNDITIQPLPFDLQRKYTLPVKCGFDYQQIPLHNRTILIFADVFGTDILHTPFACWVTKNGKRGHHAIRPKIKLVLFPASWPGLTFSSDPEDFIGMFKNSSLSWSITSISSLKQWKHSITYFILTTLTDFYQCFNNYWVKNTPK